MGHRSQGVQTDPPTRTWSTMVVPYNRYTILYVQHECRISTRFNNSRWIDFNFVRRTFRKYNNILCTVNPTRHQHIYFLHLSRTEGVGGVSKGVMPV